MNGTDSPPRNTSLSKGPISDPFRGIQLISKLCQNNSENNYMINYIDRQLVNKIETHLL